MGELPVFLSVLRRSVHPRNVSQVIVHVRVNHSMKENAHVDVIGKSQILDVPTEQKNSPQKMSLS